MEFNHRAFGGELFRPKPEVFFESKSGLLIVATPWGARSSAKKVLQLISDFVLSSHYDPEITSPFQMVESLSPAANSVRIAIMLANDAIFEEINKSEYNAGLELLVAHKSDREICLAQVGHPLSFLCKHDKIIQPIHSHSDIAFCLSTDSPLPPLPTEFIGTQGSSNISIQTLHINRNDRLIFLSRSRIAPGFINRHDQPNIDELTQYLVEEDPNEPFWIGQLDI